MIKLVIIESPYSGNIEANTDYARKAMLHSLDLGETPFASHLLYPQVLDEDDESERDWGIRSGLEIGQAFQWAAEFEKKFRATEVIFTALVAFYVDNGWSPGMEDALEHYTTRGLRCEVRRLDDPASAVDGSSTDDQK